MPLYIVRWSHEAASLIHADDEDDLFSIISERTDPEGIAWDVYQGQMWLDFDIGARTAKLADESRPATMRAVERFAASPPVPAVDDGDGDDDVDWADAVDLLEMVRDRWIAGLNLTQLREALRGALCRLDASDAISSAPRFAVRAP